MEIGFVKLQPTPLPYCPYARVVVDPVLLHVYFLNHHGCCVFSCHFRQHTAVVYSYCIKYKAVPGLPGTLWDRNWMELLHDIIDDERRKPCYVNTVDWVVRDIE